MNKQDIEDEAIKYCSHIDFSNDKSLNEKGRVKVAEWCKQDFIAGAEWMQEQLHLSAVSNSFDSLTDEERMEIMSKYDMNTGIKIENCC
jgi:hypothetical protein